MTPVQFLGTPTITGFQVTNNATTPNTKIDVGVGSALATDGQNYITLGDAVTIDAGVNGVNGLDTGDQAASTWYNIFVVGSSNNNKQTCMMISTSATDPVLPEGFDIFKKVGMIYSDASTHFLLGFWVGDSNFRQFFHAASVKVLNDGTSATLAAISLDTAVPPVQNTPVYIQDEFTPATANDYVSYFPGDSTETVGPRTYGSVAAKMNGGQHRVLSRLASSVAKVKYINSAASGNVDVWVNSYDYFV